MSRRIKRPLEPLKPKRPPAAKAIVSQSDNTTAATHGYDERQVVKALAEYFAILREWSLKARYATELADSSTNER